MSFWTTERLAELRAWLGAGLSYGAIAKRWGVSKNTAIGKARRLGIAPVRAHRPTEAPRPPRRPVHIPSRGLCQFVTNQVSDPRDFAWCAQPTEGLDVSYCPDHRRRVYWRDAPKLKI